MTQGAESIYQEYLAKGEFMIQRCNSCSSHVFYPRYLCTRCGSSDMAWIKPTGAGTVYSTTVMRRRAESGGDYNVCLVQLNEGPRLMSRVEGVMPAEVRIGMAVKARVTSSADDGAFVVFDAVGN